MIPLVKMNVWRFATRMMVGENHVGQRHELVIGINASLWCRNAGYEGHEKLARRVAAVSADGRMGAGFYQWKVVSEKGIQLLVKQICSSWDNAEED